MQSYIIETMLILIITISACIFFYAKVPLIKSIGQLVFVAALSSLITVSYTHLTLPTTERV